MGWLNKASSLLIKKLHLLPSIILLALISACGSGGFDDLEDDGSGISDTTTVSISISTTAVTPETPAIVTAVVSGGLSGVVVTYSLSNNAGELDPEAGTALTDESGTATITLNAGQVAGAGVITATISSGASASAGFSTSGDGSFEVINLALALVDSAGNPTTNVSGANPGTLRATLTNAGLPAAGVLVNFSLSGGVGLLSPETGTALTGPGGVAEIRLLAGSAEGAGTVTAFVDGTEPKSLSFSVSISAVNVSMGDPVITPASIGANGTATVQVTIFETPEGGTPTPLTETATVQFTSQCVQSGTATMDTNVETIDGVARSTYKDQGCGITDTINISATVGQTLLTRSAQIVVQAASAGSIEFVSASPTNIALKGTGGSGRSETSTVTFRVIDSIGNVVPNVGVNFSLTTSVGGLTISPDTSVEGPAQTDNNGLVDVIVQSGSVPTPVRVVATLAADNTISTVSDRLVISTGVADFNSLSLSASDLNPEGWAYDGVTSMITARASDHFNNPVPDGTAVSFVTEFGSIDPSCTTVNGVCSVIWTSGAPRSPLPVLRDPNANTRQLGDTNIGECQLADGSDSNLNAAFLPCFYNNATAASTTQAAFYGGLGQVFGNRVSIRATMLGEESFTDSNANGVFDQGEAFTDLTEAFTDDNEDGIFSGKLADGSPASGAANVDAKCYGTGNTTECYQLGGDNEEYLDFNSNQTFDLGNNIYNGVLCPLASESAGICSRQLVTIWKNITILQAGSDASIGMIEAGHTVTAAEAGAGGRFEGIYAEGDLIPLFDYRQDSSNYFRALSLPTTVVAYLADLHNGLLPSGTTIEFAAGNGEIVGPRSCVVGSSNAFAINGCAVSVKPDTISDSGPLVVTITTPKGNISSASISISD